MVLYIFLFNLTISTSWAQANTPYIDSLRLTTDSVENPELYLEYYQGISENYRNGFEERIRASEEAEKISLELCNKMNLLSIYGHRGLIYRQKGSLALAIEAFTEGFKYLEVDENSKNYPEQKGWFLMGYGNLLFQFNLINEAKNTFRETYHHFNDIEDELGRAVALNNLGLCEIKLEQLDSALYYFSEGYQIRKKRKDHFLMAHSLIYISRVYIQQGQEIKADSILQLAKQNIIASDRKNYEIDILIGWSKIAISRGNLIAANKHLNSFPDKERAYLDYDWLATKVLIFKELEEADSLLLYANKGVAFAQKYSNIDLEVEFLEAKLSAYRLDFQANKQVLKENAHLLAELYKKQARVKDDILRRLFKANQQFVKIRAQNEMLRLEDLRKSEIISLQNNSIFLTSLIAIILVIGILIFLLLYKNIKKTKNILEVIGERTKVASESMPTSIISFDSRGILRYINKAGKEYFKSIGVNIKLNHSLALQLENSSRSSEWFDRLKQIEEEANSQIISFEKNSGKEHYYVYNLTRILKHDGSYSGGVIIINDLTEIQETNIELAKKSSELKIANDAKERMLSLLAHDLKEGVVSGLELTRLITSGNVSEKEEKECLKLLEDSLSKTSNLLFKTLEWVKEQSNLNKNRRHSVVLAKLVKDVERSMRKQIDAKELEIKYHIDPELKVHIDPELIRSVLRNILSNAIKYSDKQGSSINFFSELEDETYAVLHIKDQGMGMSKKELNKLTRLDYHDSKQGSAGETGTGLGLKLVQELLLAHGSPLQVQSVLNQGSDFYFRLPISEN